MKLAAGRIDVFIARPDPAIRVVLVYGPDGGLVRERIARLTKSVVDDPSDPFRVAELSTAILKDDPAKLSDEAAAISMIGGRRVIRISDAADALSSLLEKFLAAPVGDALILLAAGDLGKSSSLRGLCEKHDLAAALPCYADEGRDLAQVIRESLEKHKLTADPEAMAFLIANLGGDRMITRSELEKLALYVGKPGKVGLAEAEAAIGDNSGFTMDDLVFAVTDGNVTASQRLLERVLHEGNSSVAVLRALSRHFQRLHWAAAQLQTGKSPKQAMMGLRPPVFFKQESRFESALGVWPPSALATALETLLAAEIDSKSTGMPAETMLAQTMLELSRQSAARRKRGR
jgi:DNA polymerase-3 subunit delta